MADENEINTVTTGSGYPNYGLSVPASMAINTVVTGQFTIVEMPGARTVGRLGGPVTTGLLKQPERVFCWASGSYKCEQEWEKRMTRSQNRRFLRVGVSLFVLTGTMMSLFFLTMPGAVFQSIDLVRRILLFGMGFSGVASFLFLVLLGVFPHIFRFYAHNIASHAETERLNKIDFFILEDE